MLPQIDEAEKRARRTYAAPLLDDIAGPDAGMIWQRLMLEQRREVVTLLCSIRILRGTPGRGRLTRSRWASRQWVPSTIAA